MQTNSNWVHGFFPWLVACCSFLCLAADAQAQLFGNRPVGGPVSRRPGAADARNSQAAEGPALEAIGTMVDESARYVRGNREATDFVGTDSAEGSRFVGSQQSGLGEMVQSAVDEDFQVETIPDVNEVVEPVIPARLRLNAPRLELGFAPRPRSSDTASVTVLRRLQSSLPALDPNSFEVSVADGVATLRGTVVSERDRKMAMLLASFEPGIARVQNELTVAGPASVPPDSAPRPSLDLPSVDLR
jgi:hypothetical protein